MTYRDRLQIRLFLSVCLAMTVAAQFVPTCLAEPALAAPALDPAHCEHLSQRGAFQDAAIGQPC